VGRRASPGGSHRPSDVASCRHRAVYEQKKVPVLPLHPPISRVQLPGSGATLLCYHLFSRKRAFRSQQQGLSSGRRQDTGSASRADGLPGFLGGFPAGFSSPICHSLESPQAPPAGAAGSGGADIAPRLRGRPRPSLLRPGSPGWGLPAPGQTRVAVHEDEDGPPGATAISPDLRPSRAPPDSACHPPQTDGVALACTGERRSRSEPARSARPTPSHQADY
jgi:hypothetical protein